MDKLKCQICEDENVELRECDYCGCGVCADNEACSLEFNEGDKLICIDCLKKENVCECVECKNEKCSHNRNYSFYINCEDFIAKEVIL